MHRACAAVWLAAAGVVLGAAWVDAEIGDYLGKPVVSVTFQSESRTLVDPTLEQMIATRVGERLTMAAIRESVSHLFSLGQFEDVRVHAAEAPGGIALTYELTPLHPVTALAFTGLARAPGLDEGRLRQVVTERFGSSPRAGRADDIARLIADQLRKAGYLHASVTHRVDLEHPAERSTLRFAVVPGVRTRVATVTVEGTFGVSVSELRRELGLTPGAAYEGEKLDASLERFLQRRRNRGYYEARASVSTEFSDQDRTVNLTVNVAEGPRVRVVFRGDPLPAERQDDLVPIAREGSTDEDLLEDSSNRIEQYLRAQGYRDATAPHSREEANGELLITFTVRRGMQYRIGRIEFVGNNFVPSAMLESRMRVRSGQPFSAAALNGDLATIAESYRREGFGAVRVEAVSEPERSSPGAAELLIRISIAENARTMVSSVAIEGNRALSDGELRGSLGLQPGRPFLASQMTVDRDAIQLQYANSGFQSATVTATPGISADGTRADVVFLVAEGPRLIVDHILIVGNERTKTSTIQRELQFKPGDPLGAAAVAETQRRLAALGLFRRARITELGRRDGTHRDVLITVEEAPVTSIGYGGGVEAGQRIRRTFSAGGVASEQLEFAPRAFFEIGRRNLFGKNRSVNLFTRISLRPNDSPYFVDQPHSSDDGRGFGFSEYRALGTFREPRVFGTPADAFLTGTVEQQVRASFNFARRAFSAEVGRRVTRTISLSGNYQIQRTELFDERFNPSDKLLIDRLFPQVLLSSFSLSTIRDTRDDPLDPAGGRYLSANAQLASRRIGSEVGFAKTFFTAQMFRTLLHARRIVLAGNARLGMGVGFPRTVTVAGSGASSVEAVRELPASERFFAGGDTTVRGFVLDRLGAPGTIDQDGFPIGGNAVVIFNAELRMPVRGGLGVVGFFDAGNVFARTSHIELGELRSSAGFGLRYKSPIGPIRFDIGFKLHRQEIPAGVREALTAVHISLGQAF